MGTVSEPWNNSQPCVEPLYALEDSWDFTALPLEKTGMVSTTFKGQTGLVAALQSLCLGTPKDSSPPSTGR